MPAIPAGLSAVPEVGDFLSLWQRVLDWDAAAGLTPLNGPHTVLVVTDGGLRRMTPCDVSDPFVVDEQLQRTVLRRHVIPETVAAADARFSAGGRVTSLDGGEVTLGTLGDDPQFSFGDGLAGPARPVAVQSADVTAYTVEMPFVNCSEVSDAIGRHPQTNPFAPPELPVPEPAPRQ